MNLSTAWCNPAIGDLPPHSCSSGPRSDRSCQLRAPSPHNIPHHRTLLARSHTLWVSPSPQEQCLADQGLSSRQHIPRSSRVRCSFDRGDRHSCAGCHSQGVSVLCWQDMGILLFPYLLQHLCWAVLSLIFHVRDEVLVHLLQPCIKAVFLHEAQLFRAETIPVILFQLHTNISHPLMSPLFQSTHLGIKVPEGDRDIIESVHLL